MKMRGRTLETIALGLVALATGATAQLASACQGDVCFKLNIPERTASSGNGDIFFQISAPSTYSWAALGQGTMMGNANMFLIYTSKDGKNVTLSPRSTSGHDPPTFNSDPDVSLLEGSGVSNGKMVANVRCGNCNSWSGGTVDFKGNNGAFVFAALSSGGPMNSDDRNARIGQHDARDRFQWSFASAKGGNSVNPLVNAQPGTTPRTTNCVPRPAATNGASSSGQATAGPTSTANSNPQTTGRWGRPTAWQSEWGPSPTGRPSWGPPDVEKRQEVTYCDEGQGVTSIGSTDPSRHTKMLIAHGVLASLAFVVFFPAGAIAIRLASFPGVVWFHAAFQIFAYVVYIVAFGMGVYLAMEFNVLDRAHPIIGIVVLACLFFQPLLGLLHHMLFKRYQSRTFWSYAHIWVGRLVVTLGIINGGLGLQLADSFNLSSKSGIIAYGVVAGVIWLVWVAASILGETRKKAARADNSPKESMSGSVTGDAPQHTPHNGHYAPK